MQPFARTICALLVTLTACAPSFARETWSEPNSGITFLRVPKGCFRMGVPKGVFEDEDPAMQTRVRSTEQPEHEVCLDEFWLARHEVTEGEWRTVMGEPTAGSDPARPKGAVTWQQAQTFARRLSANSPDGSRFRLPTEAEWEYACRAGEAAAVQMPGRDDLNAKAWFSSHYDLPFSGMRHETVQAVEGKQPNSLGLHDMLGNVWEWTQDTYVPDAYRRHTLFNPVTTAPTDKYVIRGGSIRSDSRMLRCEARAWLKGGTRQDTTGFRLVRMPSGANR